MSDFVKPSKCHLLSYRVGRGEQGVLTFEPYKSYLLPHWRFRTVPIAEASSEKLWDKFLEFYEQEDFVGMDMARKFIQMGMTRSKRYANYKGGRKYVRGKEKGEVIEKSQGHEGREEKEEASRIFRGVWERCRGHAGYQELKKEFLTEQKAWLELEKLSIKPEPSEGGATLSKKDRRTTSSRGLSMKSTEDQTSREGRERQIKIETD